VLSAGHWNEALLRALPLCIMSAFVPLIARAISFPP
jgi:hypothetical protein